MPKEDLGWSCKVSRHRYGDLFAWLVTSLPTLHDTSRPCAHLSQPSLCKVGNAGRVPCSARQFELCMQLVANIIYTGIVSESTWLTTQIQGLSLPECCIFRCRTYAQNAMPLCSQCSERREQPECPASSCMYVLYCHRTRLAMLHLSVPS